jgi:hypothetical protein
MGDTRPLSAEEEAVLRSAHVAASPWNRSERDRILATLDAERARHVALVEAAQEVMVAWNAGYIGPDDHIGGLIDPMDALRAAVLALIEEARK